MMLAGAAMAEAPISAAGALRLAACGAPFRAIAATLRLHCRQAEQPPGGERAIVSAVDRLSATGAVEPGDFDGVSIAWCDLPDAAAMTLDEGTVFLDISLLGAPWATAAMLAHELAHVRQFRRLGAAEFACTYSLQYLECSRCQDLGHALEAEAFAFQQQVEALL